jgi:hypothetical protein
MIKADNTVTCEYRFAVPSVRPQLGQTKDRPNVASWDGNRFEQNEQVSLCIVSFLTERRRKKLDQFIVRRLKTGVEQFDQARGEMLVDRFG